MFLWMHSDSNDVQHSRTDVYLISLKNEAHPSGFYVYKENLRIAVTLFNVRSLTKHRWFNDPDVYLGHVVVK